MTKVNTKELLRKDSMIADGETKDCVVYATATAFDLSYDEAHKIVKERFSREEGKGTKTSRLLEGMRTLSETQEAINGKTIQEIVDNPTTTYVVHGQTYKRKPRVYSFAQKNNQGTYLILTRNHALTIKDGVLMDNKSKGSEKALINMAYKIS